MSQRNTRLSVAAISFAYGGRRVLDGVSLTLEPGTVTAILGPNGAGKSTLLRLMAGLLAPGDGQVLLDGQPLSQVRPIALAKALAVVLEAPDAAFAWTALELVLMGRAPHIAAGRLETAADHAAALEALGRVDAASLAQRPFTQMSAGERQRVLIARALCQDTPIVLLDEPTAHLDPAHALHVATLCRELAAEGRAVGCVLHDLNVSARAADQVVILDAKTGQVAASGSPGQVLTPAILARVYGVTARRVEAPGEVPQVILAPSDR